MSATEYVALLLATIALPGILVKLQCVFRRAFVSKEVFHLGLFIALNALFGLTGADAMLKSASLTVVSWVAYGEWETFFRNKK
jgi:NADH:ubiquinone oxidoreductase subunit K